MPTRRDRCPCRKVCYTSWRRAEKTRRRLDADHVYFCAESGGYHITSWSRSDFDRFTAARCTQLRRDALAIPLADGPQDSLDLSASTREQPGPDHRDDEGDVGAVGTDPLVDGLPLLGSLTVRTAKRASPPDDSVSLPDDVLVGHGDTQAGVEVRPAPLDVRGPFTLEQSREPCPLGGVGHPRPSSRWPGERTAGYEQPGDNPGDSLGAGGGQQIGRTESGDNVGESTATRRVERVEILLVGPGPRGYGEAKNGGPTPDRADRQRSPYETPPRRESEVTLPDLARPDARGELDTPSDLRPDPDDVRPWDGWEDEDYERAS